MIINFLIIIQDDNERIMIKKSVKGAVVVAILGECASAIIKLILSYYAS